MNKDRVEQRLESKEVVELRRLRRIAENQTGILLDNATSGAYTVREVWGVRRRFNTLMSLRDRIGSVLRAKELGELHRR